MKKVLVIEDERDLAELLAYNLEKEGYTPLTASAGIEGLEIARRELPDLILLDLMMPDMDGFQVMDALQDRKETRDIPIIVITAKELTPAENKRLKGHIQSLMQKGDFMNDDLLDEVRALLK